MQSRFESREGLWPRVVCHFTLDDLLLAIKSCEELSLSFPHESVELGNAMPMRFWEERVPTLAFFMSHIWAGQMLNESGYFDNLSPEEEKERFDSLQPLDPYGKALILAEYLREKGEEALYKREVLFRQEGPGAIQTEVVLAAFQFASIDNPQAATLAAAFEEALSLLSPIVFSDTELELIEASHLIKHCGDYGHLWWHAEKRCAYWEAGDGDDPECGATSEEDIKSILGRVFGVERVEVEAETPPAPFWQQGDGECEGWVRLPAAPEVISLADQLDD
jgi:hypothetical protein